MRKAFIGVTIAIVGILIGIYFRPLVSGDNVYREFKKFERVFNISFKNYVDEVDATEMMEAAIKGLLGSLDVHSVYISDEEMKRVKEDMQGSFDGIGIEFDIIRDTVTVVTPISGGPSESLGILAGDRIVKIDGETAVGIPRRDVPKRLKGPKGTTVEVDIKRDGETELIHYIIIRDKIPIFSVDASFIVDSTDIGYIKIGRFAATTYNEMVEAIRKMQQIGMKKLVLDLRGNPGGYLQQAVYIADEFLPGGEMIVYTKGRKPEFSEEYYSTTGGAMENIPLIVLINAGSASASEIVSGAIQDLDRGMIVGTTSFGKGLVQRPFNLGDGSTFRLTISKYYTPSGRSIQRPYKDKDKYRHLVGRLNLDEGSYLENPLEKYKEHVRKIDGEEEINLDSLPIYHTKSGRIVLGGGGITPDYIVLEDTSRMTKLLSKLFRKRAFYDFSTSYLKGDGKDISTKYKDDFAGYYRNFEVDKSMLEEFKALAESLDIEWDDEQFETDKKYVKLWIKSFMAKNIWNRNRQIQVTSSADRQLTKALSLFPEVEKISSLR